MYILYIHNLGMNYIYLQTDDEGMKRHLYPSIVTTHTYYMIHIK